MSSKNPIRPSEITPEHIYKDRRNFLKSIGIGLVRLHYLHSPLARFNHLIILSEAIYQSMMKKLPLKTSRPTTTTMNLVLKKRIRVSMQISSPPTLGLSALMVL